MNLPEFHAYQNPDGTYKLEVPITGELNGKAIIARAKLNIEWLAAAPDTKDLMTFIVEDN